jgi:hypothetical protein
MRSSPTWPARIAGAVARFDAFTPDNNNHGEHDFGSLYVEGHGVLLKIEYLDSSLRG